MYRSSLRAATLAVVVLLATPAAATPDTRVAHGFPGIRNSAVDADRTDADGDGILGLADACPASPRRAAPVTDGCAAVEIVRRPELLSARTIDALDDMVATLHEARPLAEARESLERAREHVVSSMTRLRRGEVCAAARTYDDAETALRQARLGMEQSVDALAVRLLDFDPRAEDASAGDVTLGYLRMLAGRVGSAVDTGLAAGTHVDAVCATVAGGLREQARVDEVDDAAGLLTLDTGRVLALAAQQRISDRPKRLYEGLEVDVTGTLFNDGTGVAQRVDSEQPSLSFSTLPVLKPCMALRIAPVQPFAPYHPGPYTLHRTGAYKDAANVLQLERGMRLAAVELGCPHGTPQGLSLRYSMHIEVIENLAAKETVAYDFQDGDHPVAFPWFAALDGQIKATVLMTACLQFADGTDKCQVPLEQHVTYYNETLRPRGHYSTAVYSHTTFEVKDNQVDDDFGTTTAVAMDLTDVPVGSNAHFVGKGYAVSNGVSSRPQLVEVDQGETFAIYEEDDFIPDDLLLFQMDIVGVEHESGLTWPRVEGERNGSTFWYSSKLPELVRDRVAVCPDDPDTWYRLPFYGGWPDWTVNTGNHGDPTHGHDASQPYAWDLDADEGTDVAAARGGRIVWVVEDEHLNVKDYPKDPNDPTEVDPNYTKVGNFIWVLHDDGTLATYNHLSQWGALVSEGDVVHRGQHIGEVGDTGYSSHAHLHFEGGLVTLDWHQQNPSVVKLPTRFEGKLGQPDPSGFYTYTQLDCFVPHAGDRLQSTQP